MSHLPKSRKTPEEMETLFQKSLQDKTQSSENYGRASHSSQSVMTIGKWIFTLIFLAIPVLNILLYCYWAFFSGGNQNRVNFCRASLILGLLGLLLFFIFHLF